jgi:glycosyltransferase involved in cell wall biosynthesis
MPDLNQAFQRFPGRLAIQQRVLPVYRAPFFDALARACQGGLSVFAGEPLPAEHIAVTDRLEAAHQITVRNRHLVHPGSPFYQCWQPGIVKWLQDWGPDALIVEANPRYPNTRKAVRWMHARGRPVLGWGLGALPVSGPLASWRINKRAEFLNSLDALIAYSQQGAESYRGIGFPAERIFVAPNAVSPRPQSPPPNRPAHLQGPAKVLFVGRLQARKRIDNLLLACAELPEESQPRLLIVGDGPAREEFKNLAKQIYPLAEFPGAKYGAELEAYFAAADLFVLPGTGGLAVQQAMAFGLPVIVAQGDGTQSDLVRLQNGWQVPPDDLNALMDAIRSALKDIPRLRRMGAASYRIVSQEINLERMVMVFLNALEVVNPNP